MKIKILVSIVVLFVIFINALAQKSDETKPISFELTQKSDYSIPTKTMPAFDVQSMLEEDEMFPYPYRYAKMFEVNYDVKKEGTYRIVNEKDTLWNLRIESEGAYSLSLNFKKYVLPKGAKLYIYNDSKSSYAGAFTDVNNKPYKSLAIADFPGDNVIVEYYEPANVDGELVIGSIGHAYKDIIEENDLTKSEMADVHIEINCIEGKDWVLEKHAVAKISFGNHICSGALINNTRNDGTPYFLTANHCIHTEEDANSVIAYFNKEKLTCTGLNLTGDILSGATLVATDTLADFSLLLLSEEPDSKHAPYFAGWNVEDVPPYQPVCIHHPSGTTKKISIDLDSAISYNYFVNWADGVRTIPNTHWEVYFEFGFTEGGSSGSPLFDQDRRIVGQLHGGSASDLFGKLSVSWDDGLTLNSKLKPHLDPDNTGITKLDGYIPVQVPYPEVYTNITNACVNETTALKDISVFSPTSWEWSFSPTDVTFVDGTTKNSQNPKVQFNTETSYSVKLKVANGQGSDSLTFYSLINAGSNIEVSTLPSVLYDICYTSFDNYTLQALGATDYILDIDTTGMGSFLSYSLTDDSIVFHYNEDLHKTGSLNIPMTIIGSHGLCTDTAFTELIVNRQQNDNIADALALEFGINGPFSNKCCSKEENEPAPAEDGCNTQITWCEEGGVQNSVWFTFIAPATDTISLAAPGFDDQMAIYDADSAQALLSGNYTLLAANDDYNLTNFDAVITGLTGLTPGKKYWVQIDGSAGGDEGDFNIILSDQKYTSDINKVTEPENIFSFYPNPARDIVHVSINKSSNDTESIIIVYDNIGKTVISRKLGLQKEFDIDVSNLLSGVYYIKCITSRRVQSEMIVIRK